MNVVNALEHSVLGNQAEWAMCACGKWLHEDCASETVLDANGKLRMCSV